MSEARRNKYPSYTPVAPRRASWQQPQPPPRPARYTSAPQQGVGRQPYVRAPELGRGSIYRHTTPVTPQRQPGSRWQLPPRPKRYRG